MAQKPNENLPAKESSSNKGAELLFVGLIIIGVVIAIIVPATIAGVAYLFTRDITNRREGMTIGFAGLVGLLLSQALSHGGPLQSYFHWIGVMITGHGDRLDIPLLAIFLLAALFFGLIKACDGTRIAVWGLSTIGHQPKVTTKRHSMIPTAKEHKAMSVAPPPSEALTIHSDLHSVTSQTPSGQRSFPIGMGVDRRPVLLTEQELGMHAMIFGSTGSGKTTTLESLAGGLLDLGWSGVILDLKEDAAPGGFKDWSETYAHQHALGFQELRLSDTLPRYWFNPLEGVGPDEARDTMLSLVDLEDAYWAAINKKTLGQVCTLFWTANEIDPIQFPSPSMLDIGRFLESPDLATAAKKMAALIMSTFPEHYSREDFSSLLRPTKAEAEAAGGFGARITGVYGTQAGRTVLRPAADRYPLDVTQDGLTYIGLDSLGKPDLTRMVSSAVLQRLGVYAAKRTTGQMANTPLRQRFVLIDEAGWVDRTIIQNLLARARSAKISIILATQGPKDWDSKGNSGTPGFEMLAQNCNVGIIMAQGEPANAEICADYIGQKQHTVFVQQVREGELQEGGSLQEKRDHRVSPDELRSLTIGEAIVRVSKPKENVDWVKVFPRDPNVHARR